MNQTKNSDYCTIRDLLETSGDLAVMTIITRKGSTPRLPGTRMLVTRDGRRFGTVGGGFCEADAVRAAEECLASKKSCILQYSSVPGSTLPSDIICGGSLEILVEYLPADPYHLRLIGDFVQLQGLRQTPVMIVPLPGDSESNRVRCFIGPDGLVRGISPGIHHPQVLEAALEMKRPGVFQAGEVQFLIEPGPLKSRLVICGAGYIAAETAPLASHLGFEVSVLDDRDDLLNADVYRGTGRVPVTSYESCLQALPVDAATGILIVTRSHAFDLQVLRQALRTPAGYIGMIGSRHKWKTLSSRLLEEGLGEDDLKRVHCPVGLEIGADSPEEIAVSIAAELIGYRALQL